MGSATAISLQDAMQYFSMGNGTISKPVTESADPVTYRDEGQVITMELTEFVAGIQEYSSFFAAGRPDYFMLTVDGEDFAVVYPKAQGAGNNDLAFTFGVFAAGTDNGVQAIAMNLFAEAVRRGKLDVAYRGNTPFGHLIPYVTPDNTPHP